MFSLRELFILLLHFLLQILLRPRLTSQPSCSMAGVPVDPIIFLQVPQVRILHKLPLGLRGRPFILLHVGCPESGSTRGKFIWVSTAVSPLFVLFRHLVPDARDAVRPLDHARRPDELGEPLMKDVHLAIRRLDIGVDMKFLGLFEAAVACRHGLAHLFHHCTTAEPARVSSKLAGADLLVEMPSRGARSWIVLAASAAAEEPARAEESAEAAALCCALSALSSLLRSFASVFAASAAAFAVSASFIISSTSAVAIIASALPFPASVLCAEASSALAAAVVSACSASSSFFLRIASF